MLEELRITSIGVIDSAVLELGAGLTVLTGETGAGKTMVLGGLDLLLGGRPDPTKVRAGSERAVVEGRLVVDPAGPLASRIEEAGGVVEDGVVVLARTVAAGGRSRAFAGGRSVPAALLAEVGQEAVAVHGQSDQQRLRAPARQRDLLDRFGGPKVLQLVADYRRCLDELRAAASTLREITENARERRREAEMLRFGLEEIAAVRPLPEEDVELSAETERLRHSEGLRAAAMQAHVALVGDPETEGGPDVLALLSRARLVVDQEASHDPVLRGLAGRVAELAMLAADVAADLAGYAQDVDADPRRLEAAEQRRAALGALTRKYGSMIADVLTWESKAAARLGDLDDDDTRREAMQKEVAARAHELGELAGRLSELRQQAASRLGAAASAELAALAMPQARVEVRVSQVEQTAARAGGEPSAPDIGALDVFGRRLAYGASGVDEIELRLVAHRDAPSVPIALGASGGELSRVMLALEVALAGADPVGTFVFDEVDAGVGGAAATAVGSRLAALARTAQVLVVTHLPQVAAFADHHLVVVKSDDGSVVSSGVRTVDGDARITELARMLAGRERSGSAQEHARELVDAARAESRPG